mmetsp:Transcript_82113/g.213949  ORF Transcript_82113/g.213949 Transcript_82113/m.213949 type:complete len:226 (+) Transcript_82113:1660-2337(+)
MALVFLDGQEDAQRHEFLHELIGRRLVYGRYAADSITRLLQVQLLQEDLQREGSQGALRARGSGLLRHRGKERADDDHDGHRDRLRHAVAADLAAVRAELGDEEDRLRLLAGVRGEQEAGLGWRLLGLSVVGHLDRVLDLHSPHDLGLVLPFRGLEWASDDHRAGCAVRHMDHATLHAQLPVGEAALQRDRQRFRGVFARAAGDDRAVRAAGDVGGLGRGRGDAF